MKTNFRTLLIAVLATVGASHLPLSAATQTFTVAGTTDDAYAWGAGIQNPTYNYERCGYVAGYATPYYAGAFRFAGVTIPQGATITHAYLRVQAYYSGTGSSVFSLVGEADDNPYSYDYLPYISDRPLTAAAVTWSVASAWAEDAYYTSPDIASVIQEIVNRGGWSSGNALAIQVRNAAASGGCQYIYSVEGAAAYGGTAAQLIVDCSNCSGPVLVSEGYIPGATNSPSSVPTYLNNPTMYCSCCSGGLCWATCTADIMGYYDRNPYNGITYWNLMDNGRAPLLQPSQPTLPGHDQANVFGVVSNLAYYYYCAGLSLDEKAQIEWFANQTNGLAFTATYMGPVSATADRTTFFNTIKSEILAGRPIGIGSWGTYFGGAHQIPVIGYKEMSPVTSSMVYIHHNVGGSDSEYDSIYASAWGNLDMDQIIPGGTPVDQYEAQGDNTSATPVTLDPDDVYNFRQTHNFSSAGDVDWVRLSCVAGRQYLIQTTNLGASCDTVLTVYGTDGVTQLAQDDNSGIEARASKIAFRCWTTGTHFIKANDKVNGYGANANYDLLVSYSTISNAPPTLDAISNQTINEDATTVNIGLTGISAGDSEQTLTITATSGNTAIIPNPTVTYTSGNTTGTLSFTPVANANGGPVTITVIAKDNGGTASGGIDSKTNTFTVTVNAVNDAPTLDVIANQTINEDATTVNINLTGIGAGPDAGQSVTNITASSSNTGLIPNPTLTYTAGNTTGTLSFTPVANANGGPITITVIAKDNGGTASGGIDSKTNTFTVTVNAVNDAPSFVKGANQSVANTVGAQTVANWATSISAGPANESAQTLNFIVTNSNNGLFTAQPAVSATGTLTYTPSASASGMATVSAKLHDNGGTSYSGVDTSAEQVFTITVTATARPVIVNARRVLPDKFAFSYDSIGGKTYVIEVNTNVATTNWVALQTNSGDGTRQSCTNACTAPPRRYFRVRTQ
jgi:hypothetical protein